MDEGRYGLVRRQEDKHRKFVCIINDILKTRSDVYDSCLSREKYESSFRYVKNVMTVRRSLVRQKVLQKCLEMRRRGTEGKNGLYGRYEGASLHTMSRDVEAYIASKHPKVRRLAKVQRLLKESIDNGEILDGDTMTSKVKDFFKSRVAISDSKYREKFNLNPTQEVKRPVVIQTYGKAKLEKKVKEVVCDVKAPKDSLVKPRDLDNDEDVFVLKRRPTLILPPIAPTRALVQGMGQ